MGSKLPTGLRTIGDVVTNAAKVVEAGFEYHVESGHLQDTIEEFCGLGGATGAVFKLGSMALGGLADADAETRIAAALSRTFVETLDEQLKGKLGEVVSVDAWKRHGAERLKQADRTALQERFTWLSVTGASGLRSSRNWPLVHELADLASDAAWASVTAGGADPGHETRRKIDDLRGVVFEALARRVDGFATDDTIQDAFALEWPTATREALKLLAEQYVGLADTRLFDETPQSDLFVPPVVRRIDYGSDEAQDNWNEVEAQPDGADLLFDAMKDRGGRPGVVVLAGEMGVGKSCLMRAVAARLAEQYVSDGRRAVVFANWRDFYRSNDLSVGIGEHVTARYGLPLRLKRDDDCEESLVMVIDGFDEMNSHADSEVGAYFESLVRLAERHRSPVLLAMRSTIVSDTLRRRWKDHGVTVFRVDPFSDEQVDAWAEKWAEHRDAAQVTGGRLRELCGDKLQELTQNPLLLFMLARYVEPSAGERSEPLTRTEIFRTFIDETIAGKARLSGETAGVPVNEQCYRLLLQEIAWIASWPKHGGVCPLSVIRDRLSEQELDELQLEDLRSAFVLHFFEPGDANNTFEFHPEAFRHYLLAEWCVRTQWEALLYDEEKPPYPTGRTRDEAMNTLAQFPLVEVERELLNELCEELPGRLASNDPSTAESARGAFGLDDQANAGRLLERLRKHSNKPPKYAWETLHAVGIPAGHASGALEPTRLLSNYWDHALLALFGLWRGINGLANEDTPSLFNDNDCAISQYMLLKRSIDQETWVHRFNFSKLPLNGLNLRGLVLYGCTFSEADLSSARLDQALLAFCDFERATLRDAQLPLADARAVNFQGADLTAAYLFGTNLSCANLRDATLLKIMHFDGSWVGSAKDGDETRVPITLQIEGADLQGAALSEQIRRTLEIR